jgi:hypothetical protein
MTPSTFIPGLELSRRFYFEAVRPLLEKYFPNVPYAAAQIGAGSDILGFDTPMSMDHDWGPAVLIFLRGQDLHYAEPMRAIMHRHLPPLFHGFPTNAGRADEQTEARGTHVTTTDPIHHAVCPITVRKFFWEKLRYNIDQPLTGIDWLTIPSQTLREMTTGAVYYDGVGEIREIRRRLAWYPPDVWLYLLAAGWRRIAQEDHLMSRAGSVADELGSSLIGARLVRDVMNLGFLMDKQYAPYPKWFGLAFQQLTCATELSPILWRVQRAEIWQQREAALSEAYRALARMHNRLGLTEKLPEAVSNFHSRPFQVIQGDKFVNAILAQVKDDTIKRIAERPLIGSVDQFSDSTDIRSNIAWREKLIRLYA